MMLSTLLFTLAMALSALVVGLAKENEQTVTVMLKSSTGVKGTMYHPNSQGVEMPISHARALGFSEDDFMGEEPEEDEDTGESESKGDSNEDDSSGESESEEPSKGKGVEPEEETESKEEPEESEGEPIPTDTPLYDKLIKDERFVTVEALLENQEQLTDVDGIAKKTADRVIDHVKSKQG